jgi:hypothetical protein
VDGIVYQIYEEMGNGAREGWESVKSGRGCKSCQVIEVVV